MAYVVRQRWLDPSKYSIKSPYGMEPKGIIAHNTGTAASADNEASYMLNNFENTAFHVVIDEKEAIELIPFSRIAWHGGDGGNGYANNNLIGIEIARSHGDPTLFAQAEENAAAYIAHVLHQYGWTTKAVHQHNWYANTDCPAKTKLHWDEFIGKIQWYLDGIDNPTEQKGTPIKSNPTATVAQLKQWAKTKKAAEWFIEQADAFYNLSVDKGVNPVGVYAQSAKETGYGHFGGVLDASFFNPCGLKTASGGGDYDKNAHHRFKNWDEGITAQIDHLLLYAGYPQNPTPDPRHFDSIKGNATTFEALGGKWAPAVDYGVTVVKLMGEIEGTEVAEKETDPNEWMIDGISFVSDKFGLDKEQWLNRKNDSLRVGDFFAIMHKVFR